MHGYLDMAELCTVAEFDALVLGINWAEAYVREYYFLSASYLWKDPRTYSEYFTPWGDGANLRMLIILPFDDDIRSIEFMVRGLKTESLSGLGEMELSCSMDDWHKTIYLNSRKDAWVCGAKIEYTLFDDAILGPRLRYGAYPATPNAIKAEQLDDDWRLCTKCSDAWQESLEKPYAICPRCLELTELSERSE
jgi:hypothetical protein